jgi:hypothetical protein
LEVNRVAKYGKGMANEILEGIDKGYLSEPITKEDVKKFMNSKGWFPPDTYINVFLANSSNLNHSKSYRKLFDALGEGKYILKKGGEFNG